MNERRGDLSDVDIVCGLDNLGRMTSRTDAAGFWQWRYDGASSRVTNEITPFGQTLSYSYAPKTFDLAEVSLDSQ